MIKPWTLFNQDYSAFYQEVVEISKTSLVFKL